MRVAIIGGTGQVGEMMLSVLRERHFPVERLTLAASARSAGQTRTIAGEQHRVADAGELDGADFDIILMSAGAQASGQLAERLAARGALVIDNSSRWRMDPQVPLIVAGVNDHKMFDSDRGIVANPNCSAAIALVALKPIADTFGLKAVVASTYQSVSGMGRAGTERLQEETARMAAGQISWRDADTERLVGNVIPAIGDIAADGRSGEEVKFSAEIRKVLELNKLPISVTCVRVPVMVGHAMTLFIKTFKPPSAREIAAALGGTDQLRLDDIPTPVAAAGGDVTVVGRIRVDEELGGMTVFLAGDNLRKGAALNAVQLAEIACR